MPLSFQFADAKQGGDLALVLARWRDAGDSFEQIARRLGDLHNVDVTSSTVRRWCLALDGADA